MTVRWATSSWPARIGPKVTPRKCPPSLTWDRGLAEWQAHRDEIIERYPQHFAVATPEDVDFIKSYIDGHDWVVDDVRFDRKWADDEAPSST